MAHEGGENQRLYLESLAANLTGWNDPEERLHQAFQNDEFMLFGQAIAPLDRAKALPFHLEILIRLGEEESNLTPPGAFIPMLEYFEMMPALDRWVIRHAAAWWAARQGGADTVLNINLSPETLEDAEFTGFVGARLRACRMPAAALCFELIGSEIAASSSGALDSVERLKTLGCTFAVAAFGRDAISFDALRMIGAALVKIDGSIVREIDRDAVALAKVRSIHQVCAKAGVSTVAEFVEQPETLEKLREIGIDYVQGYGVAKPELLASAPPESEEEKQLRNGQTS